ncbi:Rpn family recombination-promoting nuclease/putative transposase [Cohnella sp.]|uniref:Rpn family recombination-promoting nuclease/putative transposase n=1 Tax=Cohnella sp. TaxID=1883426 RepID=UPI00356A5CAC
MEIDHDRLFKTLLRTFFKEFIELFFPEVAEALDFEHVAFLSEEVVTDLTGGKKGRVDLLVETRLREEEAFILVHLEPQSYREEEFAERMFIYAARLYEKHRKPIVPIAVFSHRSRAVEPDSFRWKLPFKEVLRFDYYALQLCRQDWRTFARSDNPVAAALLSSMGYRRKERKEVYMAFLRMIFQSEQNLAKLSLMTLFFETYMKSTKTEQKQVQAEFIKEYPDKEEPLMGLMSSYERKGYMQGLNEGKIEGKMEGMTEGKIEVASRMLEEGLPLELIAKVTGLPGPDIEKLKVSH